MAKRDLNETRTVNIFPGVEEATSEEMEHLEEIRIRDRKPRKTYSPEELEEFRRLGKTAGRKGAGMKRINISISDSNFEYVRRGARMYGLTMTEFINGLITQSMEEHPEVKEAIDAWAQFVSFD